MASVNIAIRREVYDKLDRKRSKGESFSDVIERLVDRPSSLFDYAGLLSDEAAEELRENIARQRRAWSPSPRRKRRTR